MRWLKDGVHEQAKPITGETDQRDSWVFLEPKPPVLCTAGKSESGDGRRHSQATPARFPGSGRPEPIALSGHHTQSCHSDMSVPKLKKTPESAPNAYYMPPICFSNKGRKGKEEGGDH